MFYRDGYRLAHHHLDKGLKTSNMETAIGELYQAVDDLLEAFLQRSAKEGKASDCKKGCDWCCHREVFAVTHEFLYLNEYVRQHLPPETRRSILKKAREKVNLNTRWESTFPFRAGFMWPIPATTGSRYLMAPVVLSTKLNFRP